MNHKSIFLYIMGMWGKTGINCFVLITGYFMCKSEITLRKFLKLILEIEFYNIIVYLVFLATGYTGFSLKDFLFVLLPIHSVSDGFVSCYLVFFLFIPFLNILIRNLTRRNHLTLLLLCVCIYSLYNSIPGIEVTSNDSIWFCILYIISSYLRLYPLRKDTNTSFWAWTTLGAIVLAIMSVLCFLWLSHYGIQLGAYTTIGWPSAPFALIVSICAFMLFKNINIKQSKFINIVGGGTFGVLLIHANSNAMRQWLWRDTFNNVGHYANDTIYLHAILVPILVFVICSAIEYIRMKTIEKPLINLTYNSITKYLPNTK